MAKQIGHIPVEAVATYPLPGMNFPTQIKFSPDGQWITYLFSSTETLIQDAYAFHLENGTRKLLIQTPEVFKNESDLPLEEVLRRQRLRQRELGITQLSWSSNGKRILIPFQGDITTKDGIDGASRLIVPRGKEPMLSPKISPDGEWVGYVQDAEIYVISATGGTPDQITFGASDTGKTHGLAEYIAQEEMSRREGFWWSPDSNWIAFQEVDESHIPVYRIMHQGKEFTGKNAQEDHRYPFAGKENARYRLGVISRKGGEPIWMQLEADDEYLARVCWLPDGRLTAHLENREQTSLKLVCFDPKTGSRITFLHEVNEVWINLHKMFKPLNSQHPKYPGGFIWASERTGYQHLYLFDKNGNKIRQLTDGEWVVDEITAVDQNQDFVYFMGTLHGPTEKHLYAVSLEGGNPRKITRTQGFHQVVIDPEFKFFVDTFQSLEQPPIVTLCSLADGVVIQPIHDDKDPCIEAYQLTPPQNIKLKNKSGHQLYGSIYHPPEKYGNGPFPTIVYVYGGPHSQRVTNSWGMTVNMRAQHLQSHGFLVFVLDNQGSARRGLVFEAPIKHRMGWREVEDQVEGVQWLINQGLTDPNRVGIYGWSYGGYMAAMCLAQFPEIFKVAVAGAPVTHWDGYDTHYTERYMGAPDSNPNGYEVSSVMHYASNIKGKLLLVHGLLDENVHFRHTARLINALIKARKPYDLLLFPDERHMPQNKADRIYMEQQITQYFMENL